jgi:hypothetical protein
MTTPVGCLAPGVQSVPGCAPNGEATFLDAGACSKLLRTIPSFATFFGNVRRSIIGLRQSSASGSDAVLALLQSQANLNDQTNQLNYWMRQVSPQLDKLSNELVTSNDALAALPASSSGNAFNAPGIPDSVTLLPGPTLNSLLLYFTRPSFEGASPVVGYELVTFTTDAEALAFTNASPAVTLTEADLVAAVGSAPWNTPHADDQYGIYGDDLRVVSSGLTTGGAGQGLAVRLRAYNTSGEQNAPLFGPWSAPTLVACAASDAEDLKPSVELVTTGVSFSLVEWRAPEVLQPDQSWASVGGLHSYLVAGSSSGGTVVLGGATTIAQIPLTAADTTITVAACATADGTAPVGTSDAQLVQVPTAVPHPSINVRLVTSDPAGAYALVKCAVEDYYSSTAMRYTVTATDASHAGANTVTAVGDSPVPGTSAAHNASILKVVRVPAAPDFLQSSGTEFTFTATAEHASGTPFTSTPCPAEGPFRIP